MVNVSKIKEGIVIDHIRAGHGYKIFQQLGLDRLEDVVVLMRNVDSEKMGRKAMLMEIDPKYCDVIIRRYIQESGNLDLKVERDGEIKSLKDVMEEAGATLE